MHPLRNALAALLLTPCILPAAAPPRVERWDAARSPWRVPPVWRGETVGLECAMPGADLDGAEASFLWQTNGMAGWWSAPAAATNGAVLAVWTPAMDCGAAEYRFFLRAETAGGVAYRANGTLAVLGSPGEDPGVLAPPFPTLDLSAVEVLNAPWATPGDVDEAIRAAQIAGADLSAYATWQGLDSATNALRQGVDAALGGYAAYGEDGDIEASAYTVPWGYGGYIRFDGETVHFRHPGMHGFPGTDALVRIPFTNFATNTLATEAGVAAAIAAATNGLLSAEPELAAIREAAASIALPPDPTAAEIGAALTNLISIIAGHEP